MKRKKRIAVVGSAANPPTKDHRVFAEILTKSGEFDLVLWFPSGSRHDKPELVSSDDRARMTELVFDEAWRKKQPTEFRVDLREVHRAMIPTTRLLEEVKREHPDAEIIFATGVDVLVPRQEYDGKCAIAHYWVDGEDLMKNWTFAVLPREGYPHPATLQKEGKLPEHFMIIDRPRSSPGDISSTEVRRRIKAGEPFDDLVDPAVAEYIREHGLYR